MPRIMGSMNRISRCQATYRTEKIASDLGGCHHSFVLAICRMPGKSQEELARDLCLNKSTVARSLTQLEDRGYVTRTPNPADKRQMLVYPTEKMLDILPKVRSVTKEWNDLLSEGISEEELAVFESVLHRMEQSAKEIIQTLEENRKK